MSKKNEGKFRKLTGSFFRSITRKKAKERWQEEKADKMNKIDEYIEEYEKTHNLSDVEREEKRKKCIRIEQRKIAEEEAKKAKGTAVGLALAAMLGVSYFGGYALGAANNQIAGVTRNESEITVDMDEVEQDVEIENVAESDHDLFVKELQDQAINDEVTETKSLKNSVYQKISSLDSHDEVMEYLKQLCVDEYNNSNDQEIDIDDVTLNVDVPNQRSI